MCIIAASARGIAQPDEATLERMFDANPHGAGYMVARNGRVEISKGFMTWHDFRHAVRYEKFTEEDPVVYHFRISTQAGVNPTMTHPFPLTRDIRQTKRLDCACNIGVAHNGIISLTSNPKDKEYSDTAHYIAEYLCYFVRRPEDLKDPAIIRAIDNTTHSKLAIMDSSGEITLTGSGWIEENGIEYSNSTFRAVNFRDFGGVRVPIQRGRQMRIFEDEPYYYG